MKKKTKIFLGIGIGAFALLITSIAYKKYRNYQQGAGSVNLPNQGSRFPLTIGSGMSDKAYQSSDVKTLQKALNRQILPPLMPISEDGKFGNKTAMALDTLYKTKSVNEDLFNKIIKA